MSNEAKANNIPAGYQPECIIAQKLFDWVVLKTERDFIIPLSADCLAAINAALALGQTVEGRATFESASCEVINVSRIPNGDQRLGRVVLQKTAVIRVQFFNTSLNPEVLICDFVTDDLVTTERVCVCFPQEFTIDNINCNIFQSATGIIGLPNASGNITVQTDFCQGITVEDFVQLEVLAKYCTPRENTIECGSINCVFPIQPQQCPDIFPHHQA